MKKGDHKPTLSIIYKKSFCFNSTVTWVKQISVMIIIEIDPLLKIYSFYSTGSSCALFFGSSTILKIYGCLNRAISVTTCTSRRKRNERTPNIEIRVEENVFANHSEVFFHRLYER